MSQLFSGSPYDHILSFDQLSDKLQTFSVIIENSKLTGVSALNLSEKIFDEYYKSNQIV